MGSTIAEIVPPAIALVLVNPLPLMAIILLLFSPRARVSAPAFVVGWMLGMVVVFSLLLLFVPRDSIAGEKSDPSTLASTARLVLGIVLLYLAAKQWRGRPEPGAESTPPPWMLKLEQAPPLQAMWIGAALSSLNPKNLAFTISAFVTVVQAELETAAQIIPIAVYVLVGSIGVMAPVLWYFVKQERATKILAGWRVWLAANYSILMAVVLLLFGIILSTKGIGDLIG